MKTIYKLCAFFLLIFGISQNAIAWNQSDTWWEGAYLSLHAMDWGQTRDISIRCQRGEYRELNPILGRCPERDRVDQYFISTALLHAGVTYLLPSEMRRLFQLGTIGLQLSVVNSNAQIGLNIVF